MKSLAIALAAIVLAGASHADAKDVFGIWLTEAGTAKLEISDCGDGSPCGRVVALNPDTLRDGLTPETTFDENNPDPALRDMPILGLLMLSDFEARRSDWRSGRIYDPETGRTYGSRLKKREDGTLEVKGCLGPICQTQVWTPDSLEAGSLD